VRIFRALRPNFGSRCRAISVGQRSCATGLRYSQSQSRAAMTCGGARTQSAAYRLPRRGRCRCARSARRRHALAKCLNTRCSNEHGRHPNEVRSDAFGAVPVIDISGYFTGEKDRKRAIAAEIDAACRSIGFLVISGHNVPDELLQRTDRAARDFFAKPLAEKRLYKTRDPAIYRGF
jgi:hypothetical protein